MVFRRQYSLNKINYEINGQKTMFGRDNLIFKTLNLPKKQTFQNLCNNFKIKKFSQNIKVKLIVINI